MKILKLQFLNRAINVGLQAQADDTTHDIRLLGGGYLLTHRQSGRSYWVHGTLAVAEVDTSEDDDGAGDATAAAGAVPRRGAKAGTRTQVPTG